MLILLHIDYSLHMAMACLSSCPETMACKAENIYRHALFYCAPLYCISHVWFFCFVYKLKVCGSTAWSKSIGTIFLVAFTHLGFTFW